MHRWAIIDGTEIAYETVEMTFASYDDAELWILNHQLGRRNLLKRAAVRKLRGDLYNRLKKERGGDPAPQNERPKGQNVTLNTTAAETVAETTGVSSRTVKRDGIRAAALDKLTRAAAIIAENASDKEVKLLAALEPGNQDIVARAVRTGQDASIEAAMKRAGFKPKTRKRGSKGPQKGTSRQKTSAASLVDTLTKKHIGHVARGLTNIAEVNGGEGAQFKAADAGLNQLIRALQEMRKGKQ
jgi:hypothetical protein